eukprot:4206-Heterococcus_DN1.PRE.1
MALAYCCYSRPVRLIRRIFARDDAHVTVEIVPGGSAEAPANLHAYANSLRLQQSDVQSDHIVRPVALTLRRVTLLMNSTLNSCNSLTVFNSCCCCYCCYCSNTGHDQLTVQRYQVHCH